MAANQPYNGPYEQLKSQAYEECLFFLKDGNITYRIYIKRLLGHGKFGYVYPLQRRDLPNRIFAVKIVDTRLYANAKGLCKAEADLHCYLSKDRPCPHILKCYGFGFHQDIWALTYLELMPGGTLEALIDKGPLPSWRAAIFTKQLTSGLVFLHEQGYAHRDLTAKNLLLTEGKRQIKIADFGLATRHTRTAESGETILSRTRCGALHYMAPEVCLANMPPPHDYDAQKVDIWSVGIVLYYMLHRCFPWELPDEAKRLDSRFWCAIFYEVLTTQQLLCDVQAIDQWALELTTIILNKDPKKRLTAGQLLTCKWLKRENMPKAPPSSESWPPDREPRRCRESG